MICLRENNQGAELLIGYLEGTLSQADRQALDNHAAQCTHCQGLLAAQVELVEYAPEVSPDFDAKLYARIAADQARQPWWKLSWKVLAPAVGVAAMLAVAMFVRQPAPQLSVDPAVSQDVQLLEQALENMELLMPPSGPESL